MHPALTERTLLADVLPARPPAVDVDDENWRSDLAEALHARVPPAWSARPARRPLWLEAIRELMVDPLEINWLHVHPQLEGITREGGLYSVSLSLREAPQ